MTYLSSHQDLCSVDRAVDRFMNAVERPFRKNPLSTRNFEGLYRYRTAEEEARSRKVPSPDFDNHINVGAYMPSAP